MNFVKKVSPRKDIVNLESFGVGGTFLKQRRLLFMLVLTLVLSTSIMFTACTPNIGGPSAEEIAAQKEAEEKKAARAPFVGVWEAKSISDPSQGDIPESVYPTAVESMKSIYGYDFADDGTGNFIRFGAQKPFTWSVDANGKLTITLAGNAGSYTATVDSSGQMTIEGSDGSKAVLKQITKTSGDYSSLKYKPFDAMADKGTIAYNFSSTKGEYKMRFKLKTEVDKVLIDNDDLYVRYVGIAKSPDGYSEGYVFEIINRSENWVNCTFKLDNSENSVWAYDSNYLERGERVFAFVVNSANQKKPLADQTEVDAVVEYYHIKGGKSMEDTKTENVDLIISQKK